MTTDPATMLRERITESSNAFVCDHCHQQIMTYPILGHTPVTLDVYPTEDGTWAIKYDLTLVHSTSGPQQYREHICNLSTSQTIVPM